MHSHPNGELGFILILKLIRVSGISGGGGTLTAALAALVLIGTAHAKVVYVDDNASVDKAIYSKDNKVLVVGSAKDLSTKVDATFTNTNDMEDHAIAASAFDSAKIKIDASFTAAEVDEIIADFKKNYSQEAREGFDLDEYAVTRKTAIDA
jgi:hypothetical protein